MMSNKTIGMYNGYKNYNHWNVSLWINNDEGLYNWARELTQEIGESRAAEQIYDSLKGEKTPDGVTYSKTAIRSALRGI